MAKHPMLLLLLLAVWVLVVGLWLEAEALRPPIVKKLCGQEFMRTALSVCEHPETRWSRSAFLTQELMGEVVGGSKGEKGDIWDMGWAQGGGDKNQTRV